MENKIETHLIDKEKKLKFLGEGEWVEECDQMDFTYKNYECRILRIFACDPYCKEEAYFGGHLCGYVKVDENVFNADEIDCHGGITYNTNGWIGFDCAHSCDYMPSMQQFKKQNSDKIFPIPKEFKDHAIFNPVYRNMEFCVEQCKEIVEQLIKAKKNAKTDINELSTL